MPDEDGIILEYKTVIAILKLMNKHISFDAIQMLDCCIQTQSKHIKFKIVDDKVFGISNYDGLPTDWHIILHF